MGLTNGAIVADTDGGKPVADTTNDTANGTPGASGEPEIIHGFAVEGPATERIGGSRGRTNRFGKPDGRTTRHQRGQRTTAGTEEKESVHLNKISLDSLLYSLHLMGAEILAVPELELDKDESKKLGDAIQEVGKHYAMAFDPKHVAILNLCVVAGMIYGTRIVAVRARVKKNAPVKATPIQQVPRQQPQQAAQPARTENAVWNPEQSPSALYGDVSGGL